MIKNFTIKNTLGIEEMQLDFEIKGVRANSYNGIEDQIAKADGKYFALTPTFIAKNAAGKTSIIKALEFASRFFNRKNFINELVKYASEISTQVNREMNMKLFKGPSFEDLLEGTRSIDLNEVSNLVSQSVESNIMGIFHHMSRDKMNDFEIEVCLNGDEIYTLIGHSKDISIMHNNKTISLYSMLFPLIDHQSIRRSGEFNKKTQEKIKLMLSKTGFAFNESFETRVDYLENKKPSEIRKEASVALMDLFRRTNAGFIENTLKKMDENIFSFSQDAETGLVSIKRKDGIELPVNNLSFGTIKTIVLLDKAMEVMESGGVLFVDEIENGLHISLISLLVRLFSNEEINKRTAQLILTTHNPLLIEREIITYKNVLVSQRGTFAFLKTMDTPADLPKTELDAYMKSKNYYNDYFWSERQLEPLSSLSRRSIRNIINELIHSKARA